MIRSSFILFFFGFIIINLCVCILVNFEFKNKKVIAFLGYILSLMVIISFCFFPFPFQDSLLEDMIRHNEGLTNNFVPFKTIFGIIKGALENKMYIIIVYQIIGNIILFMPAGFSLYFFVDKKRRMLRCLFCIIFTSLSVEALQGVYGIILSINYRSVDIDDLLLNVIGGVLGFTVASFVYDCKDTLFVRILRNRAE